MFRKPQVGCDASTRSPESSAPRGRHIEMLVISSLALLASFLLSVGPGERVHVTRFSSFPIPKTCMTQEIFGVSCPGCGLTRSFVHLAHFDWQASWDMHRIGWLMFLATLIQIPYRTHALLSKNGTFVPVSLAKAFGNALIVLLIANWLCGIIFVNVLSGN